MKIKSGILLILFLLSSVFFSSCEQEEDLLERRFLFSLPIGKMEDHLFVQQFDGVNTLSKTRIMMEDGFFFITNGESAKVMEFTSFGDLVNLFYNEDENPEPVILGSAESSGTKMTRAAYKYPFSDPGEIAKTGNGILLVDDRIAEQRREYDEEQDVMLDRIILNFNENGEFVSYLGQEGPGGTPFPYIHALYTNEDDEITVVTRNPSGWEVFWFTYKGDPLYRIDFNNDLVPMEEGAVKLSIENIIPDLYERILYLKLDYYTENEAGKIKYSKSVIMGYNLDEERYSHRIEVPRNIVKSEQPVIFEQREHEYLYEFAGIAYGPSFFLLSPYEGTTYRLTIIDIEGAVKGRGLIEFSDEEVFFRSYHVNAGGIFSAIVCGEYDAEVVWWRTDRFIEEPQSEFDKFIPNERN